MVREHSSLVDELGFLLSPPVKPFSGVDTDPEEAKIWIIGVPFDSTVSFRPGTRFAPAKIREVGWELESYNPLRGIDVEDLQVSDVGDIPLTVEYSVLERHLKKVIELAMSHSKKTAVIGGEHLITLPIVKTLKKRYGSLRLVVFDAHLDLRDEYPQGSSYSHATVMRRISEMGVQILYYKPRAFSREEYEYLSKTPIVSIAEENDFRQLSGHIYISIDVDAIDPSYAPGVGNPEPLGITPHEILDALSIIASSNADVVGFDIVETNPLVDVNDVTSLTAAKILMESLFLFAY